MTRASGYPLFKCASQGVKNMGDSLQNMGKKPAK